MNGILNALCALPWKYYAADVVAVIFFIVMTVRGAKRGFINSFFGIVSTFVAFMVAVTLSKSILNWTGGFFGMENWLIGKLEGVFAKLDGFTADISGGSVEEALKQENVSAVFAFLVLKTVGKQTALPSGTTLASLVGGAVGRFAALLIVGIILFILVKLIMRVLRGMLDAIASKITLLSGLNSLLGTAFGFLQALLVLCTAFSVLALFSIGWLENYLAQTYFIGRLYENNPLFTILGWFL